MIKKLLFTRKSDCIQPLRLLIEQQKHRTLVAWALECSPPILALFEKQVPHDGRPRQALVMAESWSRGLIKMPLAKQAIHEAHNAATQAHAHPAAQAAARAMGHAAATVHVETHALGLVFYGLTALVYASPPERRDAVVEETLAWFIERLRYWEGAIDQAQRPWATFLLDDDKENKEWLLHQKEIAAANKGRKHYQQQQHCVQPVLNV